MTDKSKKNWNIFKETDTADSTATPHTAEYDEDIDDEPVVSPASALEHPSYRELEEKLTLAEQKVHEHWDKLVRSTAELDNIRRRAERDVANAHRYSLEKFSNALLPVVDSLEQALQLGEQSADTKITEGLDLTMKLLVSVLEKFDVIQLNPHGETFDPQSHEAMSMQVVPDAAPNSILAVVQKGYRLNDRVIRPARVIVAKAAVEKS